LPVRIRSLSLVIALVASLAVSLAPAPAPVTAGGQKVAIIVGPVGSLTNSYRNWANEVAAAATAQGATVVKAYSPSATWSRVRDAVSGANVIVYFGHGNGFPNPYGTTELKDRTNGWGLNTATTNGDADSWSAGTLVYCGEKALLGTIGPGDGAAQRTHCTGGIAPAPGFTMVYAQAHYAPGFGERYAESTPVTTLAEAQARVRNYSYPILAMGGTFFATAYGDADEIVQRVLSQPETPYGEIFAQGRGYSSSTLTAASHPDVGGNEYWVQRTTISGYHFGDPDYWYAFAGDPLLTPSGSQAEAGPFTDIYGSAFYDDIVWLVDSGITTGCGGGRFCPRSPVSRAQMASFLARALDLPPATHDHFTDDNGTTHEHAINRLADAGIVSGCAVSRYCPDQVVTREQMAAFLHRALD
jgi:S-layer homology domain